MAQVFTTARSRLATAGLGGLLFACAACGVMVKRWYACGDHHNTVHPRALDPRRVACAEVSVDDCWRGPQEPPRWNSSALRPSERTSTKSRMEKLEEILHSKDGIIDLPRPVRVRLIQSVHHLWGTPPSSGAKTAGS